MEGKMEKEPFGVSLSGGSETVYDYFCDECWEDGKDVEGDGYCLDCQEYLCKDCLTVHKKTKLTRRHELLDKDNMPRDKPQSLNKNSQDTCTDICLEHRAEIVKYYCEEHDVFGCTVCVTINHRNCQGVGYIPQLCEDLENSGEYQLLKNELQIIDRKFRGIAEEASSNIPKAERICSSVVEGVKQLQEEAIKVMKTLETTVKEQAEQMKDEDVEKMKTVKSKTGDQILIVERINSKLETLQEAKQLCHLFAAMKESKRYMGSLQSSLTEMESLNNIREYSLVPKREFLDYLKSPSAICDISRKDHDKSNAMRLIDNPIVSEQEPRRDKEDDRNICDDSEATRLQKVLDEPANDITDVTGAAVEIGVKDTPEPESVSEDTRPAISDSTQAILPKEPEIPDMVVCGTADYGDSATQEMTKEPSEDTDEQKNVACDKQSLYLLPRKDESQVTKSPTDITATHVSAINVKTDTDASTCYISGCVLLPSDNLLLSDFSNSKVKMFDSVLGYLKDELKTESGPWEIAQTAGDKVAVTMPYRNKIIFLKVSELLTTGEEFSLNGNCRGVVCHKDMLIVSYTSPPKLELLDFKGIVLKTLVNENRASRLLGVPYHVTVRNDDGIIYVSNSDDGKIISLTLDGKENTECKDMKYPRGMYVDSHGFVYVCARDFHYMYLITPECRNVKTILTKADGLQYPMSACCDEQNRKLYVGMNEDVLKVFQLS